MSSKITVDDHTKFLIACIKHGTGKPDWDKVVAETGIVSKGAAQKRYERIMKAHAGDNDGPGAASPLSPCTPSTPKSTGRKKQALASDAADGEEDDGSPKKKRQKKGIAKVVKHDKKYIGNGEEAAGDVKVEDEFQSNEGIA